MLVPGLLLLLLLAILLAGELCGVDVPPLTKWDDVDAAAAAVVSSFPTLLFVTGLAILLTVTLPFNGQFGNKW